MKAEKIFSEIKALAVVDRKRLFKLLNSEFKEEMERYVSIPELFQLMKDNGLVWISESESLKSKQRKMDLLKGNPYPLIAKIHCSIKELESIIAEKKREENKLEVLTEEQKKIYALKKRLINRINH